MRVLIVLCIIVVMASNAANTQDKSVHDGLFVTDSSHHTSPKTDKVHMIWGIPINEIATAGGVAAILAIIILDVFVRQLPSSRREYVQASQRYTLSMERSIKQFRDEALEMRKADALRAAQSEAAFKDALDTICSRHETQSAALMAVIAKAIGTRTPVQESGE